MKRLSREEIKPPGLEWSFDISLILDHIQSEVKGGDQATTTQSRAHATLTAQNLLHTQYMHKLTDCMLIGFVTPLTSDHYKKVVNV